MRASEERALTLYRQGKVPGSFYDGRGQEAISVGSSFVLGPRDRMCILHRDLGAHFVRGVTPDRYLANFMGRAGGVTGGRDGNMHFGDRRLGCVGMVSMLPDMAPVATGLALAFKMRREPRVAMTYFGEGSTRQRPVARGDELRRHPPAAGRVRAREQQVRVLDAERARVRGRPGGARARATASRACRSTATTSRPCSRRRASRSSARATGDGPTLIECHTMRMHGHGAHDDMCYVPKELLEEWEARDPIDRYAAGSSRAHGFSRGRGRGASATRCARGRRVRAQGARVADARSRARRSKACSRTSSSRSATATRPGRTGADAPNGAGIGRSVR